MSHINPASTRRSPNGVSILGQRRKRWANIETTFGERLVYVLENNAIHHSAHRAARPRTITHIF